MNKKLIATLLVLAGVYPPLVSAQGASIPAGTVLKSCNDGGEWPPYFFYVRRNGEATDELVGYDIDLLNRIMADNDIGIDIGLISWSRCQRQTEEGRESQITSSVAYSKERDQKYLLTDTYYTLSPHYFYHYANYPDGLRITRPEEVRNYRVCGLRGYNYTNFGIDVERMDNGSNTFTQVIEKTRRRRCDIFVARYEIFSGFARTGTNYIRVHNLGHAPIPGAPGDPFHMMISRNYEHGEELRRIVNAGLARMRASGEAERLLRRYIGG